MASSAKTQNLDDLTSAEAAVALHHPKREWICGGCTTSRRRTYYEALRHSERGHSFRNQYRYILDPHAPPMSGKKGGKPKKAKATSETATTEGTTPRPEIVRIVTGLALSHEEQKKVRAQCEADGYRSFARWVADLARRAADLEVAGPGTRKEE